jgi:hypothetical protein
MIFVMHIRRQLCTCCGRGEAFSTLYQAEEMPRAGAAHKLLPCHSIGPLDPIHRVELPIINIPVCEGCVESSRAQAGSYNYSSWKETIARKYAPVAPAPKTKAEPSLDDLA